MYTVYVHVYVDVLHRLTFKRYRDKYREKTKSLSPSSSLLQQIRVRKGESVREGGREGERG